MSVLIFKKPLHRSSYGDGKKKKENQGTHCTRVAPASELTATISEDEAYIFSISHEDNNRVYTLAVKQ